MCEYGLRGVSRASVFGLGFDFHFWRWLTDSDPGRDLRTDRADLRGKAIENPLACAVRTLSGLGSRATAAHGLVCVRDVRSTNTPACCE
jgi:hypothetical protein